MSIEALPAAYREDPIGYYSCLKRRIASRRPALKIVSRLENITKTVEGIGAPIVLSIAPKQLTPEQREIDRLVLEYRDYLEGAFSSIPPAPRLIIRKALQHFGITHEDLISERRTKAIVAIRHQVMWALRTATPISLPHIGRMLGNRDHTTVLHGWKKIQGEIDAGLREAPNWWAVGKVERKDEMDCGGER